jgi:ATP-dependent Clp protease ATP-binding subunit ClpA
VSKADHLSFTERTQRLLLQAYREAESSCSRTVGTEHFLLALAGVEGSIAQKALQDLGLDRDRLLDVIKKIKKQERGHAGSPV